MLGAYLCIFTLCSPLPIHWLKYVWAALHINKEILLNATLLDSRINRKFRIVLPPMAVQGHGEVNLNKERWWAQSLVGLWAIQCYDAQNETHYNKPLQEWRAIFIIKIKYVVVVVVVVVVIFVVVTLFSASSLSFFIIIIIIAITIIIKYRTHNNTQHIGGECVYIVCVLWLWREMQKCGSIYTQAFHIHENWRVHSGCVNI